LVCSNLLKPAKLELRLHLSGKSLADGCRRAGKTLLAANDNQNRWPESTAFWERL
jgi:hypothetical protein